MHGESYCIICGKKKTGIPVTTDRIIESIRWFKKNITKDERGNKLVVCKEDYETYKKNRDRYTSRQAVYLGIGFIFVVLGLVLTFNITSIFIAVALLIFLYLLSLMNYTPSITAEMPHVPSKKQKHNQ